MHIFDFGRGESDNGHAFAGEIRAVGVEVPALDPHIALEHVRQNFMCGSDQTVPRVDAERRCFHLGIQLPARVKTGCSSAAAAVQAGLDAVETAALGQILEHRGHPFEGVGRNGAAIQGEHDIFGDDVRGLGDFIFYVLPSGHRDKKEIE
jgi:hypothetical protein